MIYEVTFSQPNQRQSLPPYVKVINRIGNDATSLKVEVLVQEEDMSFFEQEMDCHTYVKRWHRYGGNDWCEIITTTRKAHAKR